MYEQTRLPFSFRLLHVYQADRHLLSMEWCGSIYLDNCLPLVCDLFRGFLMSYLIYPGLQDQGACLFQSTIWTTISQQARFPLQPANVIWTSLKPPVGRLALEKVEGSATYLIFLSIMLDTHRMEIRLPDD